MAWPAKTETFMLFTTLLDSMGFGLIGPVLPRLVEQITGSPPSAVGQTYGLLNAAYAMAAFLCATGLGHLSDRFGRRPVILLAIGGGLVNYVLSALAGNIGLLFLARIAGGICGASAAPAIAYIADITTPVRRPLVFGWMGAAFGLGFILGPALGGLLGDIDPRLPFWVAAGLSAVNLLYGWLFVPESLPPGRRTSFDLWRANPLAPVLSRSYAPFVRGLLVGVFLYAIGQAAMQTTWVLFVQQRFGWTEGDIGLSLAAFGVIWIAGQALVAPAMIRRLGESAALLVGQITTVAVYLAFGLIERGWQLYLVMPVVSVAAMTGPAVRSLLSRHEGQAGQGEVQGAVTGVTNLAAIFGPLAGAWIFQYFTGDRAPVQIPGAAFFLGGLFAALSLLCAVHALASDSASSAAPVNDHPASLHPHDDLFQQGEP